MMKDVDGLTRRFGPLIVSYIVRAKKYPPEGYYTLSIYVRACCFLLSTITSKTAEQATYFHRTPYVYFFYLFPIQELSLMIY